MGISWHTMLLYRYIYLPPQAYSVLHACNWHSKNHLYTPIYPKGVCFPKNNHRRLFIVGHWGYNFNYEKKLKTLSFLLYGDATKNVINWILHILHRSTSQPRLQNLPLPPLLPQTQNKNFNFKIYPAYQYQLRGWKRFINIWGWNHFIRHPQHLQDYSLSHHPAWI